VPAGQTITSVGAKLNELFELGAGNNQFWRAIQERAQLCICAKNAPAVVDQNTLFHLVNNGAVCRHPKSPSD